MSRRTDRKDRRAETARRRAGHLAELEITVLYHQYSGVASTTEDHAAIARKLAELTGLDSAQVAAAAAQHLTAYRTSEALRAASAARDAEIAQQSSVLKRPAYCTKHVYSGRRLVNQYGGIHRTPGPACDGTEHEHRMTPWWW
jgi:antirestriction protein ArdC